MVGDGTNNRSVYIDIKKFGKKTIFETAFINRRAFESHMIDSKLSTPHKTKVFIESCTLEDELEVMLAEEIERNETLHERLTTANAEIETLRSTLSSNLTEKDNESGDHTPVTIEAWVCGASLLFGFDLCCTLKHTILFAFFALCTLVGWMTIINIRSNNKKKDQ